MRNISIFIILIIQISLPSLYSKSTGKIKSRNASNRLQSTPSSSSSCCNIAGIVNPNAGCTSGTCSCKLNVKGSKCDECKEGTYNLDVNNPDGCSLCYCFGATNVCGPSEWPSSTIRTPDQWLISDLEGKKVIEPEIDDADGHLIVANDELPGLNNYYWDAPQEYLGQKLYSYGGDLKFVLSYVVLRGDVSGWYTEEADVVLQGGPDDIKIGYNWKRPTKEEEGKAVISLPLREQGWFKITTPDGKRGPKPEPVSREEFTLITYDLKRMLIRAKFHTDQITGGLHNVDMMIANQNGTGPRAKGTEQCSCPEGYAGLSCERCADGWRRVNNTLVNGKCEKCDCNGHSPSCDPYTGKCTICLHHTIGQRCDRCEYGFYGDPTRRKKGEDPKDDCKPCACPLLEESNNFSPSCHLSEGTPGGYICDECPIGYTGDRCDRCADGYFGNPTVLGDTCKPCDCGPGANTSIPNWCDHRTGLCLRCRGTIDNDCKRCPPRHVLTELGCKLCEDPCVDMALDDIYEMSLASNEANLTGIKDLPKIRLRWMEGRINETMYRLMKYQTLIGNGQRVMHNFTINFDLEALADILYLKAKDLETQGLNVNNAAVSVGLEAEELLDLIHDLLDELNRIIDMLRKFGLDMTGPGYMAIDRLLYEAERILRELMSRNFIPSIDGSERELRKAKHLLDRVRALVTSPKMSNDLRERLERLRRILSDTINIVQTKVQEPTLKVINHNEESRNNLNYVIDAVNNSTNYAIQANASLVEARRLLEVAKTALIESAVQFGLIPRIKEELANVTSQLEHKRGILSRLNPEYNDKFVKPCISHVDELRRHLDHVVGLFDATREVSQYPMQAATVYQKIVDALAAAENAAKRAYDAGERAYKQAYPGTDDALVKQAEDAKERSYALLEEARNLRDKKVPDLERDLGKKRFFLDSLSEDINNSERNLELIRRSIESLPRDLGKNLKDSDAYLRLVLEGLHDSHTRIDYINQRINDELGPKLDRLNEGSASGIENLTKIIEKARSDIRSASRYASNSEEINERIHRIHEEASLNLKELKDRILMARQKASSIKVSLGVDPSKECVRSFKPEIEPSTTNTIVLNYAIKDEARDALLFFISSSSSDDFMAIEMVDRKIRFLWNAGGGTQVLSHTRPIETNDPHLLKDNQWYKIQVHRIGNIATLKVTRTPEADYVDEDEVTGSSPPNYSKMDLDPSAYMFVGSLPHDFRAPRELRTRRFAGCMYEVILDGKRIGLWNFKTNYGCRGCKEGAVEPRDPSTFSFIGSHGISSHGLLDHGHGHGYKASSGSSVNNIDTSSRQVPNGVLIPSALKARMNADDSSLAKDRDRSMISLRSYEEGSYAILPQIKRYDRRKFLIVFQFKTFDEDALLFFSPNPLNGDFVSIYLKEGRINYQFNFATNSRLTLTSKLKYNTGQWVRLSAERDRNEGILSVDDELLEGKVASGGGITLELSDSLLYWGGVPPNFTIDRPWESVTFNHFLGCMKDLQIDTTPLGLLNSDSYGVDVGCKSNAGPSVATFKGQGSGSRSSYIELRSIPLKEEADITFTFRTIQSDTLLLLSTFQGQSNVQNGKETHFYSVAIVGGLLEARFNGGAGETPLISEHRVNDGKYHTITISKRHRTVTMSLDDTDMGRSRLAKGTKDIDGPSSGGLFFGGVPRRISLKGMAGTKESLIGIIRDVVINKKVIKFNEPVSFDHVDIGRESFIGNDVTEPEYTLERANG